MDEIKPTIESLEKSESEFSEYNRASYIDTKSPLSLYCEARANMAACDMAYYSKKLSNIIHKDNQ